MILQYHHVSTETPSITSIAPALFEEHMDYLANQGFEVWPLGRLVAAVRAGESLPPHVVAITFDDAYVSIYDTAFPILKRHGFPFTIFVATEYIDTNPDQYLSWNQLREMKAAGATIANHSHTHTHLLRRNAGESPDDWRRRIKADIEHAQTLIEQHLGDATKLIAYPYGEYDDDVIGIIDEMGFTGFGQQSGAVGPTSRFEVLPRFPMGGPYSAFEPLKTKVATRPMPIRTVTTSPLVGDNLRPVLTLDLLRTDLRQDQLVCYGPGGGRIEVKQVSPSRFTAQAGNDIPVGRSRYNCTMPDESGARFYWFSQLWIRKEPDGSWYPEP
ncbi:MAG: polysaccharide deacetylase family protein [Pseudomonadales bacterium]|nr:polysaccharide deacetylase family protein [Pseudomonadales bacterium]